MGSPSTKKLGTDRSTTKRKGGTHGVPYSKIIKTITIDGQRWELHATKGWRKIGKKRT